MAPRRASRVPLWKTQKSESHGQEQRESVKNI